MILTTMVSPLMGFTAGLSMGLSGAPVRTSIRVHSIVAAGSGALVSVSSGASRTDVRVLEGAVWGSLYGLGACAGAALGYGAAFMAART